MKLTKCVNGHFYDEEKFETCPHCAGTSKLNASSIFGQSSAPKPAAGVKPEENDDVTVPLEWEPAAETTAVEPTVAEPMAVEPTAAEQSDFAVLPEEPEFVDAPKEAAFTAPPEEPEFVEKPQETAFTAPPEEPEFVEKPQELGFIAPPEEPEFVDAPKEPGNTALSEEAVFNINAQPSFDTPLDFDNDFTVSSPAEDTVSETEEAEEEEFELLSKYSSDSSAEEQPETPVFTDAGASAWEMPQPNVEEIKTRDQEEIESVVDPELEDQPTEIVEEAESDLVNGLLSEEEITGNVTPTSSLAEPVNPAFSVEPEAPVFSAEPVNPAFSVEPKAPVFSAEPVNPAFSVKPEAPASSAEPAGSAFVPEQPNAFNLSSDADEDDDGHTVAFYDDIFHEVSKTATAVEQTIAAKSPEAAPAPAVPTVVPTPASFADAAAKAAAEVAMSAIPAAETPKNTAEEPSVFTAPPLPHVQTLPTPCVGWLIALNGAHIGQDFHLRVGKNYVGRDESMDVALTGDKSVSRHKHAIIIYEPKHHKYFIQPGESNELIYVNDEVVLLPMELKPYDLLVIGDIELWFMPLCDAEHNWSEVIRKLQEQMQQ